LVPVALSAQSRAQNVVLFLADAGGTSTIAAASLHGYGAARRLFIQRLPHIGLSDTSSASHIVTDSAAGMTAIVTGERTNNGVVGQSATAVRKKQDGEPLKSILEYAEERGLSTGIITNDAVTGATPASLYAKVNDRGMTAAIFQQLLAPRFGDGVDVMIGAGRAPITKALAEAGLDLDAIARQHGRPVLSAMPEIGADATRAIVLLDSNEFAIGEAVETAIRMLSKNPTGYFLMVESDVHTDRLRRGLNRLVDFDRAIERAANLVSPDTLLVFTADHSFDVRLRGGRFGQPLLEGLEVAQAETPKGPLRIPAVRVDNGHTGEEVLVAARGPGAERVSGYMANTDIFRVMMAAYGWPLTPQPTAEGRSPQPDGRK
ncbi:MAG: alkaline phosphatase, partial [Vicinamibacterales bacterium]